MLKFEHFYRNLAILTCFFAFSLTPNLLYSQDVAHGKELYVANCASCHKLNKKLIGPALGGVTERRTKDWLVKWIRNNAELRASGDADAIAVFEEYNGSVMSSFLNLSDQDIDDILAYTDAPPPAAVAAAAGGAGGQAAGGGDQPVSTSTYFILLSVLILVVSFTFSVKKLLLRIQKNEEAKLSFSEESVQFLKSLYKNKAFVFAAVLVLISLGARDVWNGMMQIGIDQGYQPVQPIAFSHKIHAGENKIDCKYCHSSVRTSKHSGIPSANVCMNCHMYIQEVEGSPNSASEIQKIYDAVGFDPETLQYIEDYEEKPIKWVRIHNMQDFVYFNHNQHVNVGGIACQKCHGPIEEMEEVYQHSPLTMGWCIDCHRETQVKMADNPYYEKIHAQLADKHGVEKVTVAMMGGLECGKCHY